MTSDEQRTAAANALLHVDVTMPTGRALDVEALYSQNWLPLVRLAALLLENRASGEDVVQDAFLALHRHADGIREPAAAVGYLRTAVVNGCRSTVRRRQVARRHAPKLYSADTAPADEALVVGEEHRAVIAALHGLPQRRRETLILRYWSDLSDSEIAEAMGVSVGTVRSAASRGIAEIKHDLEAGR